MDKPSAAPGLLRRRWLAGGVAVVLLGGGAAVLGAAWPDRGAAQQDVPVTTSPVALRDLAQTLRLTGTAQTVTRTVVGEPSLRVQVALPAERLFELVPAVTDGRATVTVAVQDRTAVTCAEVQVRGVVPAAEADLLAPSANQGPGGPELVCALPESVVAYLTESATVTVAYVTSAGRRAVMDGQGTVSEHREPDVVERDHDEVVADVDPSLLHLALPAVQAATATGQAIIASEGRTFPCASLTLVEPTVEAPDKHTLSCLIPEEEKVYAGSTVTVIVTVARAEGVLSVPATAVRTSLGGQGVVTVVVPGADGSTSSTDRTVELGVSDGLSVEIRAGLALDDLVLDPAVQE